MDTKTFKSRLAQMLEHSFGKNIASAESHQLHDSIAKVVMEDISAQWKKSTEQHLAGRRAMYLSMEFLMGRAVYNNLLCLGLTDVVDEALKAEGRSLAELEDIEDAALGNGGLGRLAACFLDSAAAHDIPLDGYGIRYKYGLFKQSIVDGFQHEEADNWTKYGDPWSVRHEEDQVEITYGDQKVLAVPYDMPIIGYGTKNIGTLRLWQAESADDFDFAAFDSGDYDGAVKAQNDAENISKVLYPNDNCEAGKILRLKQEYFFSAASVADALRKHKKRFGTLDNLADYVTIQLNDTHPVIAIPELIRQLIKEGFTFDKAFDTAHKVFNYTNHTIMAEALEKWDSKMVEKVLPDVYAVILQINERFYADMYANGLDKAQIRKMAPVGDGMVKMAFMAIFVSSYINGVAAIHTEILKNDALKEWYEFYPERFQNKTNGITQRRWLALCNPELSAMITKLLGSADWVKDLDELKKLEKFTDDESVLNEFMAVKEAKKHQLADFIKAHDGKDIDPDWIFDIQIKRLHEYKRQFLNALGILYIYFGIKDGSIKDFTPTVFIFGAKSAPGYRRAKAIIKLINEIGDYVNADPETADKLKVVFVQNYNVSYAEKLVCAADVSEQISTAGTEASGTGNMKLMLNGAVTLGTYDGANVEIAEEAGEENEYIFGARVEELAEIMPAYDPRDILFKDGKIKRVLDKLIDGTFSDGGVPSDQEGSFRELYKALTDGASWHVPDHYYVLGDLNSYIEAKLRMNADYKDRLAFAKKCWLNICNAGKFSSDRTIKDYAENIWKI
ncbi:MAG: glycogen/starch/alpha-glucan phosphorylase [Ruminococcus sp.]|uniref:glycogen/starch/alpha-glucan phosphorylase n=1 Tax=Ruminococcus sp. TaxID=41978 RepID=UPI0025D85A86|nr:glycogen/starch/alpha-glucan phosphorylase [Ruminococcus sp.]MBR0530302.1 glycogen/starch/alpha-glucan phosphorylase [Ruminococcus sp.]